MEKEYWMEIKKQAFKRKQIERQKHMVKKNGVHQKINVNKSQSRGK